MTDTTPVTQIIYLSLNTEPKTDLSDSGLWKEALDICERSAGCERIYWGRSLEHPEQGQLHIVRRTVDQHQHFLQSEAYESFIEVLGRLTGGTAELQRPLVRHARLKPWSADQKALAGGAPFTGTAIYLNTTDAWDEGAWPLWTHVVRHVDGCMGGVGGPLLEPVEATPTRMGVQSQTGSKQVFQRSNIVYVGWETVEAHDRYHHTKHFARHGIILTRGNDGYAEYGHVVFEGSRENVGGSSARL